MLAVANQKYIADFSSKKQVGNSFNFFSVQANSVVFAEVEAPAWLHRYGIGKQGANVRKITQEFPKVHIEFTEGENKIKIEGPPEEVEDAVKALETIVRDLVRDYRLLE